MEVTSSLFLIALFVFVDESYQNTQEGYESTPPAGQTLGQPWPMPKKYSQTKDYWQLSQDTFKFSAIGKSCDILDAAFERYFKLVFYEDRDSRLKFRPASSLPANMVDILAVNVAEDCSRDVPYPSFKMDESYTLSIDGTGATLSSQTIWGALRGLETFSQIVYQTAQGTFQVNSTMIDDAPRFSHRGILLDTSRHFLKVKVIKEHIEVMPWTIEQLPPPDLIMRLEEKWPNGACVEAMAQNKFNVLHWHIVDNPSFPYESPSFPDLSAKGAYDPFTHVYSQADIADIIEFSRLRGIRVIPEFDTPGHTLSWGKGQPGLLTPCYKDSTTPSGTYGPIDPTKNATYVFMKALLSELVQVFPDKYIHLGGDEVSFNCWASNPNVAAFMTKMGFGKDFSKLEQYYEQNLLNLIPDLSEYIIWQEVIDNGCTVKPDTVVEVWKGSYQAELNKVTKLGYHTIVASPWYLDYISYGPDWHRYYTVEPLDFNGTAVQEALVIGGEACLWGEFVDDTNLIARMWPRASAVGERLWSPKEVKDINEATPRMKEHRCRMVRRGLNAEPITGPGYCKYEARSNN